jgi:hypothetical protein
VLGVQQSLDLPPDPVAVPVELQGGDPVDGFPAACLTDPVVLLGRVEFPVALSSWSTLIGTPASVCRWA